MLLKHAVARLVAAPMFTLFCVLSLAVGVAVTTAVYSIVETLHVRNLGVRDADRLAFVVRGSGGQSRYAALSQSDFDDLLAAQTSFSTLSGSMAVYPAVRTSRNAEVVAAEAVDGAYFATLAIGAHLGRVFQPADAASGARVTVLSDEFWRSRFAADRDVLGRTIRINGQPFEVVGVVDARYHGTSGALRSTRLWIPLAAEPALRTALVAFGRLTPGTTVERAAAEVATIASRLDRARPVHARGDGVRSTARAWSASTIAALGEADAPDRRLGLMIVALVALVLVVACTNIANLVLARGAARQGELAVRLAMGATRARLIREQCVESAILGGLGLLLSYVVFQLLSTTMTAEYTFGISKARATLSIQPALSGPALAAALASTLLALLVFGIEPAVQLARTVDIRSALARGASGIRPRVGRQRLVIRWQVAVATGFFIVATMFIRGTLRLAHHDPGVEMDRIAVAALNFQNGSRDEARIRRTIDRVVEEARKERAIDGISVSTGLPFGVLPSLDVGIAVPEDTRSLARPPVAALAATPSLFRTLGIPIVRGRGFGESDGRDGTPVVVLSELTARQMFGSSDAVGRPIVFRRQATDVTAEVIGIARDTDVRFVYSARRPLVYFPLSQQFDGAVTLTARSAGNPARAVTALREAIRRVDPDLAVDAIGTGRAMLAGPFELLRSAGMASLYLGAFTLLLSMVGLFGVQSHVVAHRTREIGVRMSMGADAAHIRMMVMKDGCRPVVEGLVLGLWGGLAGRLIVRGYLAVDVNVLDPWMLAVTPVPLVLAAFGACYVPAARAARVDPLVALRTE